MYLIDHKWERFLIFSHSFSVIFPTVSSEITNEQIILYKRTELESFIIYIYVQSVLENNYPSVIINSWNRFLDKTCTETESLIDFWSKKYTVSSLRQLDNKLQQFEYCVCDTQYLNIISSMYEMNLKTVKCIPAWYRICCNLPIANKLD